ncbi:MAG: ECF transporter S component [Caldibacillus debilis]|jgi:riboflavin transporter FmnP|uniref:Riboflavin transporter n=1 Tax=Caldibacillus debilis TaxID=301148 RepID=A0A3E0K1P9_9BACI|nr:ECF transporter S component [Caldibacillus debilis]MBO2482865.1 ECF transporter S component [Bacillaceae bacterium]MBY6271598.1 ECF transporter S component [Bacillaceae bacterium]OUM89066.1 MAG: riboflavin transporter FmnP [Caldibacillus debilis]REJ16568.1 MAG: ECF transporter S component [Caldibacillus debilis]REJ26940.1 MAG: ECF transporter S component [Caldibacillus debilis]
MEKRNVKRFAAIGMLSALSYVLMLLNFPLPPFPKYLQVDFSDIPALIAAIVMGPMAGVAVELVKNVLDMITTGSETGVPVGHFANFVAGVVFILPVYAIYIRLKNKKGMAIALIAGTVTMALVMSVMNYFILLPLYVMFMNFPALSGPEALELVVTAIFPFNVVKGLMITALFMLIFAKIQDWLLKQQRAFKKA